MHSATVVQVDTHAACISDLCIACVKLAEVRAVCRLCQLFATHKEDKKKVLEALKEGMIPVDEEGGKKTIALEEFTFQRFICFYLKLCGRNELTEIFDKMKYVLSFVALELINSNV